MNDSSVVLKSVTLCAIVRDEMTNPAGGIEDFVRCTVPYVEAAVILDTGSKDGTWEKLQELRKEHPQMEIFQAQFTDYAGMRNLALSKVRTPMVLVLDADERLFPDDFSVLAETIRSMESREKVGINFVFWWVHFRESDDRRGGGNNPRLFCLAPNVRYRNISRFSKEFLCVDKVPLWKRKELCLSAEIEIKHFCPKSMMEKCDFWYRIVDAGMGDKIAPSESTGFEVWKKINPRRRQFA